MLNPKPFNAHSFFAGATLTWCITNTGFPMTTQTQTTISAAFIVIVLTIVRLS